MTAALHTNNSKKTINHTNYYSIYPHFKAITPLNKRLDYITLLNISTFNEQLEQTLLAPLLLSSY